MNIAGLTRKRESQAQRIDRLFKWIASAIRFQKALPHIRIHVEGHFIRATPPSLS